MRLEKRRDMEVINRVVVVTGGARGIGRALARRFAQAGAEAVVVADVDEDGARTVGREIDGMAFKCDVSREDDVAGLVNKVQSSRGRSDRFGCSAAIVIARASEAWTSSWHGSWDV